MTVVVTICVAALLGAAAVAVIRAVTVRGLPDRSVAVDTALALGINALAMLTVVRDDLFAADLVLAAALLGALGALSVARFVERRGS